MKTLFLRIRSGRLVLLLGLFLLIVPGIRAQSVFINELTYDSNRLLNGRFQPVLPNLVEIAGPAGTNLTNWRLILYGSDVPVGRGTPNRGRVYDTIAVSGLIQNQQNGYGTLAFSLPPATLQTAPGSGIALINASGTVAQLVSYGSSLTAVNGPAAGMVAQVIPRVHSATNGTQSLQLQGRGARYTDFTWSELATYSPGRVNAGLPNTPQVFVLPTTVELSVSAMTVREGGADSLVVATVTASAPVVGDQSVRLRGSGTNITGDDYRLQNATITILSGATSGSTVVTIRNDDIVEGTDTLRLTIDVPNSSLVLGTATTRTIAILDNDAAPGRFVLTEPTYNCATGAITLNTSGGDGTSIMFDVPGVQRASSTARNGVVEDGLRGDPKVLVITATQSGVTVRYAFDFAAFCAQPSPPASATTASTGCGSPVNTLGQPLTLLIPVYDCATGVIRFYTTGGNSSPITFAAAGITPPTTNCIETLDPGNRDNDTYTITASQNGVTSTIVWTRPCRSLRRAAEEPVNTPLTVTLLGNPVTGDAVRFEVRGAEGQFLETNLIDSQGRSISKATINQPGRVEQQTLQLNRPAGTYLLQVKTARQRSTVKVLKE
ncbi:T9SS type A sorting domain-containing protein [Spirosoma arcticum]